MNIINFFNDIKEKNAVLEILNEIHIFFIFSIRFKFEIGNFIFKKFNLINKIIKKEYFYF